MIPPWFHALSYAAKRSSSDTASALTVATGSGTPAWDHFAASRYSPRFVRNLCSFASGIAPLLAGIEKLGVRWKTVSCAAWDAMIGMDWIAEEPVPMTATRLPEKSTPSCGQRLVKYTSPAKELAPAMSTSLGMDRQPVAMT